MRRRRCGSRIQKLRVRHGLQRLRLENQQATRPASKIPATAIGTTAAVPSKVASAIVAPCLLPKDVRHGHLQRVQGDGNRSG